MSEPIKVDIWSDVACPWCYIGKRKFEAGSAAFQGRAGAAEGTDAPPEVVVEYHSYELSPDTPVDFGGSEIDFLAGHKNVPREQVDQMLERVSGIAQAVGLDYHYDSLQHTNTVLAHQLLHYAKAHDKQLAAKERLLRAYFIEGRHVGRIDDLADLAAEVGLDRGDVIRSLTANEYLADVRADQEQAQGYGIPGVPFFVIDSKYGISGAQEAEIFASALEQVWAERSSAPRKVTLTEGAARAVGE